MLDPRLLFLPEVRRTSYWVCSGSATVPVDIYVKPRTRLGSRAVGTLGARMVIVAGVGRGCCCFWDWNSHVIRSGTSPLPL